MMRFTQRLLTLFLAALLALMPMMPAQAAMIGTEQIINPAETSLTQAELQQFLDRDATQKQLHAWGISPEQARERINNLTDTELARINRDIGNLDAGSSSVLGVLLIIFIVFVITDVIGATDIFPFIHPVN